MLPEEKQKGPCGRAQGGERERETELVEIWVLLGETIR